MTLPSDLRYSSAERDLLALKEVTARELMEPLSRWYNMNDRHMHFRLYEPLDAHRPFMKARPE